MQYRSTAEALKQVQRTSRRAPEDLKPWDQIRHADSMSRAASCPAGLVIAILGLHVIADISGVPEANWKASRLKQFIAINYNLAR